MKHRPRSTPLVCPACGQPGNQRPGLRLSEFASLDAVFVMNAALTADETVPTPQRAVCNACSHAWAVVRGSIEVRKS